MELQGGATTFGSRFRSVLDLVAAVAMIAVAGVVAWRLLVPAAPRAANPARVEPVPKDPIAIGDALSKSNTQARVAVMERADLECPACAAFANTSYKAFVASFVDSGRVRMLFEHVPLPKHAMAMPAAIAE